MKSEKWKVKSEKYNFQDHINIYFYEKFIVFLSIDIKTIENTREYYGTGLTLKLFKIKMIIDKYLL